MPLGACLSSYWNNQSSSWGGAGCPASCPDLRAGHGPACSRSGVLGYSPQKVRVASCAASRTSPLAAAWQRRAGGARIGAPHGRRIERGYEFAAVQHRDPSSADGALGTGVSPLVQGACAWRESVGRPGAAHRAICEASGAGLLHRWGGGVLGMGFGGMNA